MDAKTTEQKTMDGKKIDQKTIDGKKIDQKPKKKAPTVEELVHCPEPFCATRDDIAPLFTAEALINGEVSKVSLEEMRGQWVMLFFYASNFTFV